MTHATRAKITGLTKSGSGAPLRGAASVLAGLDHTVPTHSGSFGSQSRVVRLGDRAPLTPPSLSG